LFIVAACLVTIPLDIVAGAMLPLQVSRLARIPRIEISALKSTAINRIRPTVLLSVEATGHDWPMLFSIQLDRIL
jgi:hypothetical protein